MKHYGTETVRRLCPRKNSLCIVKLVASEREQVQHRAHRAYLYGGLRTTPPDRSGCRAHRSRVRRLGSEVARTATRCSASISPC